MKKTFLLLLIFVISLFIIFGNVAYCQQPVIAGDYSVGDSSKCTIKMIEDNKFVVLWINVEDPSDLEYKEDVDLTHEHIWLEKIREKVVGNFIMHENYLSGRYVRFSDNYKTTVVKLQ